MKQNTPILRHLLMPAIAVTTALVFTPVFAASPGQGNKPGYDRSGQHAGGAHRSRSGRHGPSGEQGDPSVRIDKIFSKMDADGSDSITLDEFLVRPLAMSERGFDHLDADDDGLISSEEFLIRPKRRGHGKPEIDQEAVRACVAELSDEVLPEKPDREIIFAETDTNGDSMVDLDEFTAGRTERSTTRFGALDTNGDGALSKEEVLAGLESRQNRRELRKQCAEEQFAAAELTEG